MKDSILNSIKKLLGIDSNYTVFDTDIIIHINSVFSTLNQLGVGPKNGFKIVDEKNTWNEFLEDENKLELVKTYVYQKVKLIFDPPTTSFGIDAITKMTQEAEWRLNVMVDPKEEQE